ncbi:MAG: ABC transporter permease [Pirellulaceae bacterium]|nr:ABC transporter permease [Pirellulaceae bacterium]
MLTVSGLAVALSVFCFVGAVQRALRQLTASDDASRVLIVFQENRFCPASSRLPLDYADRIRQIPGVDDVMPVQVWTNNCRLSLDAIVFHGVPASQLPATRALRLVAGDWEAFHARRDAALVGQAVASRRALSIGDTFTIGDMTVHVAGVFRSSDVAEESLIYTHLEFLQFKRGADAAGLVTQHEVHLEDATDPDTVAREIDQALRSGPVATTTRPRSAFQASTLADLVDLVRFARWLGLACLGLVLSIVGTTTVMGVQDRVREHAILQTLGLRPGHVFRLIVAECLILSLVGGTCGTGLALAVLATGGLAIGAEGVTLAFLPSWHLAALGLSVSLGMGLVAGVLPAWQAARAPIVASLHWS